MADVWHARHCTLKIVDADSLTIDDSTDLATAFDNATSVTTFTAFAKDVTITEPEGAIDKIDLLGTTAVNNTSFQNAVLDKKPYGLARLTATLILDGDEVLETFAYGDGTSISDTHTRYQATDANRSAVAVLVSLVDGTDQINIVLDNAYIIDLGDRRLSGADGHWEQEVEIVCLPKDFYIEYKN